jgi:hypothetical protein
MLCFLELLPVLAKESLSLLFFKLKVPAIDNFDLLELPLALLKAEFESARGLFMLRIFLSPSLGEALLFFLTLGMALDDEILIRWSWTEGTLTTGSISEV